MKFVKTRIWSFVTNDYVNGLINLESIARAEDTLKKDFEGIENYPKTMLTLRELDYAYVEGSVLELENLIKRHSK